MELRVLRYFLTVAQQENITRARKSCMSHSQPSAGSSLRLRKNWEFGCLKGVKGKIVLTNEGILLCRRAREILELVDKTEKELVEQESVVEGTISIGCGGCKRRLICWRR